MKRVCPQGHEVSGDNAKQYTKNGKVQTSCRQCAIASTKRLRQKSGDWLPSTTQSVMRNYKEPLREVTQGYGYYGTIAYDESQQYTQCHLCGNFYKTLGVHIRKEHDKSPQQYKDELGLPRTLSLLAPKSGNKNYEQWQNMSDDERKKSIERMKAARDNRTMPNNWRKKSLYQKNVEGRCPDQILDKILTLSEKLGKTPTRRDFQKEYGTGMANAVYLEFGTWNEAVKNLNLSPNPKSPQRVYDRETLLMRLFDFRERNGREPMSSDCDRGMLPDRHIYAKYFGSFSKAKEYVK